MPTGTQYVLDEDVHTRQLLTVGRIGAGKTTLLYRLMDQLSVLSWCFDLKQDDHHLVPPQSRPHRPAVGPDPGRSGRLRWNW